MTDDFTENLHNSGIALDSVDFVKYLPMQSGHLACFNLLGFYFHFILKKFY